MPDVWNIGNTTVRNPNRIELGLQLFEKEFQGRLTGEEAEIRFTKRLVEEEIITSESEREDAAFFGRKWRNVFVKLGFATDKLYRGIDGTFTPMDLARDKPEINLHGLEYELTPVGNNLLRANSIAAIQDVYLRQLITLEIPNPIEGSFPDGEVKPFILLLQLLKFLFVNNEPGLSKSEVAIFIQPFINHTPEAVNEITSEIINFRQARERLNNPNEKRRYEKDYLEGKIRQFRKSISPDTVHDYADTTFRYCTMTGLVSYNRNRLKLNEDRINIIDNLLSSEPLFLAQQFPFEYLSQFYQGARLPTDDVSFSRSEIIRLREQISYRGEEPRDILPYEETHISELERIRYNLLEQLGWLDETNFAISQSSIDSVTEIINYLHTLNTGGRTAGIDHPPSYLEWAVWRSFLAINQIVNPIHETRGFQVDENLRPRNTAPGGRPDMLFEFDDYVFGR
jgi:hypothetical protein